MKDFRLTVAAVFFGLFGFFLLLGWAGDVDYTEQIILDMTQEQYDSVKQLLTRQGGHKPSERDIAHWWAEHHSDRE